MSLYANYGPDDDTTMSSRQVARIEQKQAQLQAQYESDVQRDHYRFYGAFTNHHEFDVIDFSEILEEAFEYDVQLPETYAWLAANPVMQAACQKIDKHSLTSERLHQLIFETTDDNYQDLLDLADDIFVSDNHDIHDFDDDFNFIYDLDDQDDLHALAEKYYENWKEKATMLPKNKAPQVNQLNINDLNQDEQAIYERFTDILSQEYNVEDPNIRWSRIGQLIINSGEY